MFQIAVEQFWERGYDATSVRDLAQAMVLTTAIIYNAFGDKRAVYRRALVFLAACEWRDGARGPRERFI
ncbi:helix-turn-helix domain-containing protein, partial [Rhizobium ruizarguesonis]